MTSVTTITMNDIYSTPIWTRRLSEIEFHPRSFQTLRKLVVEPQEESNGGDFLVDLLQWFLVTKGVYAFLVPANATVEEKPIRIRPPNPVLRIASVIGKLGVGFNTTILDRPSQAMYRRELERARAKHLDNLNPLEKHAAPEIKKKPDDWASLAMELCADSEVNRKMLDSCFPDKRAKDIFYERQKTLPISIAAVGRQHVISPRRVTSIEKETVRQLRMRIGYLTTERLGLGSGT